MTDVTPSLTRKNLSRSSSATRAQQQPLQRREATHTLPMVNTPSPPDYTLLTVQPTQTQTQTHTKARTQTQTLGVQKVPQSSRSLKSEEQDTKDSKKQEQQQQQQVGFRKGSSHNTSNIYSPGVDYSLTDKGEVNIKKKSGTAKGLYSSLPNSKLMQIPLFRPRGDQIRGATSVTATTTQGQGQGGVQSNPLPFEKQALVKQPSRGPFPAPTSTPTTTTTPNPNPNIFESMNPFKGFNPFGINQ